MDMPEVIRLLAEISLIDDRVVKLDETEQIAQVRMWSAILREVPFDFAGDAVGQHYAECAWPVMPKDITARWRIVARRRLDRHTGTFEPTAHPHVDPDDITGFQAALRAERQAVRLGSGQPVGLRELVSGSAVPPSAGQPTDAYEQARQALRLARAERAAEQVAS